MSDNKKRVPVTIADATVAVILDHIDAIEQLLPFLLSREAGGNYAVLQEQGDDSVIRPASFIVGSISLSEVLKDRTAQAQFLKFLPQLRRLTHKVENTFEVISNEFIQADLANGNTAGAATHDASGHDGRDTLCPGRSSKATEPVGKISHIANVRYLASSGKATPTAFRQPAAR